MRPTTIEHNLKESHVIDQLNKLGFYDTAGKSSGIENETCFRKSKTG